MFKDLVVVFLFFSQIGEQMLCSHNVVSYSLKAVTKNNGD